MADASTGEGACVGAGDGVGGARSLVVGVGACRGTPVDEVLGLVRAVLREAGLSERSLAELATVDAKGDEPGIVGAAEALGVPLVTYTADELARVRVPNPSGVPLEAFGTPSVSEAAALVRGGQLLVPKRKSTPEGRAAWATCAVARRTPHRRLDGAEHPAPRGCSGAVSEERGGAAASGASCTIPVSEENV